MSEVNVAANVDIDTIVTAWNSHDPARLAACYASDAAREEIPLGAPMHGQTALITLFASLFHAFPDLVMTAGKRVAQGENLVWEWIMTGTHQGEFNGVPPTGNTVHLRGVSFCSLRGGKVAEDREYWDLATMLKQLSAPTL